MTVEQVRQIVLDMAPELSKRMGPAYLGYAAAAVYCGVSIRTLQAARQARELCPSSPRVRGVRFAREELDRWMHEQKRCKALDNRQRISEQASTEVNMRTRAEPRVSREIAYSS